jgi:hypothetical protein
MELTATTRVTFPREHVFKTYRDRIVETVPFLPNIRSIEVKERRDEGGKTDMVNVWTGKTELPLLAKRLIKADMLSWTDRASWDEAIWQVKWRIETHAFPGLLECTGHTDFVESGTGTEIKICGDLFLRVERAHLPRLLAAPIEKLIVTALKPNLLSTGEGVARLLASQKPG